MHIRKLLGKDAPLMLEWMHDKGLVKFLSHDFPHMCLQDCIAFIESSHIDNRNVHRAVCNEQDEYLGTVSLKNVDYKNRNAEYAIAMRSCALGSGAAKIGTEAILYMAFEELELNRVYLNVLTDNVRANRFYEKMNFRFEGTFREHLFLNEKYCDLNWYAVTKAEYQNRKVSYE